MEQNKISNRDVLYDIAKGLAIISVVLGHNLIVGLVIPLFINEIYNKTLKLVRK